jgi:hypothetical protein
MILNNSIPWRLQFGLHGLLGNLGSIENGNDDPSLTGQPYAFVDIHGNPVAPPLVTNPLTGEQSIDPAATVLQNPYASQNPGDRSNGTSTTGYAPGYFQSLPGVKSGAIALNAPVAVVVQPQDFQQTGVLNVQTIGPTPQPVDNRPSPAAVPGYVGPARPSNLPTPANTATQTFTQPGAPVPQTLYTPPAGSTGSGGLLPGANAPGLVAQLPDGSYPGPDTGAAATASAPAPAPKSSGGAVLLLILAALAAASSS